MWFIGVEVVRETSAPPPKNNPGSAPVLDPVPRGIHGPQVKRCRGGIALERKGLLTG